MERLQTEQQLKLQEPGRGLPLYELFVARLLVGLKARITSRREAEVLFKREKELILKYAQNTNSKLAEKQVLIKRLRGMEDSSRNWSIYMTIEHLCIVNQNVTSLIENLVKGRKIEYIPRTEDVKPPVGVNNTVITRFEQLCETFENTVNAIQDLNTSAEWPHPWFGPLNAAKWHFFIAFHMGLHRRQIEAILKKLR
jgi:hypothetical protein